MTLEEQRFVREAAGLLDRGDRGILDLSGKNVVGVMNGIFSSAVASLAPGQGQLSTLLSSKGRLVAAFQLFALEGGALRLVFFEPLRDSVRKAIHKYAFLSDIALAERGAEIGIVAVEGRKARAVLEAATGGASLPDRPLESRAARIADREATVVRAGESPEGGFELWLERSALESVTDALLAEVRSVGGGRVGPEAAEALRIEAGLARAGKDYDEESFPNDVGLEGALTYDKCYVGQEVVARMRTYGQTNRRLEGLLFTGNEAPSAPLPVSVGGEDAGRLTSSAFSGRLGRPVALAMVKRRFWDANAAVVQTPDGPRDGQLVALPIVRLDEAPRA